jgi:hypothetical protein
MKDIAIRALKTFVQAFLATLALGVSGVVNGTTLKALLIASASAGVSAVWNTVIAVKNKS